MKQINAGVFRTLASLFFIVTGLNLVAQKPVYRARRLTREELRMGYWPTDFVPVVPKDTTVEQKPKFPWGMTVRNLRLSLDLIKAAPTGTSFKDEQIKNLIKPDIDWMLNICPSAAKLTFDRWHEGYLKALSKRFGLSVEGQRDEVDSLYAWAPKEEIKQGAFLGLTGLRFSAKGMKEKFDNETSKTYIYYLSIPVYITYHRLYDNGGDLFGGLGPYVGFALFGKSKDEVMGYSNTFSIQFGKNNGGYKRFDAGLSALLGYFYRGVVVQLTYDYGLVNILYDQVDKIKNRSLGIALGYYFVL